MRHRALLLAVLVYVSLDLSQPGMPGAFVFEPSETVDGALGPHGRAATEVVPAPSPGEHAGLRPPPMAPADRSLAPCRARRIVPPVITRLPRAALDAAPSPDDPFSPAVARPSTGPNLVRQEATMPRVGRFVVDPAAGAYCQVVLDSGEKLMVNHDKGGMKGGRITIELTKLMGFSSEQIFTCDLDSAEGKAALGALTRDAPAGSVDATPLGAFVNFVTTCASVADVKARWGALAKAS